MKFRKRPVIVEAIQFTGDNADEFKEFVGAENIQCYLESGDGSFRRVSIKTDSGINGVCVGDWIIKGTEGEVYPCKPDVFSKIYEKVEE